MMGRLLEFSRVIKSVNMIKKKLLEVKGLSCIGEGRGWTSKDSGSGSMETER